MPVCGRPDEHRRENRLLDALAEAGLELGVGDLLALEVLRQDVVVGLGRGFEQLVPATGDLVVHLGRDRGLDLLAALPRVGLAMDEVDVASEAVGRADGQLDRRDLLPEGRPKRIERRGRIGVLLVALVDEEARGRGRRSRQRDRLLETRLDPARRVHDEDRAVAASKPEMTSATKSR